MLPSNLKRSVFSIVIVFYFSLTLLFFNRQVQEKKNSTEQQNETSLMFVERISNSNNVNPHNYKYILNAGNNVCGNNSGKNVTLLAFVPISAKNFKQRFIIRSTWASKNIYPDKFKMVFMLGDSDNKEINNKIR